MSLSSAVKPVLTKDRVRILLLLDPPAVALLEGIQRSYLAKSDSIDIEEWRCRPTSQKLGENMARLVSPLL